MTSNNINWGRVGMRLLGALILVYFTYNPGGPSWFHWTIQPMIDDPRNALSTLNPLKVLGGIGLAACWWFFLQSTQRSLGIVGSIFVILGCAAFFWLLSWLKIFTPASSRAFTNLVLIAVALILGLGLSWSELKQELSGQATARKV